MKRKASPIIQLLKRGKRFNLLKPTDFDRDGVPSLLDCKPYNKNKQGGFITSGGKITGVDTGSQSISFGGGGSGGKGAGRGGLGGGSSSGGFTPVAPSVEIKGHEVFINGQGFSVAPENQAEFISSHTSGGYGLSAQIAIKQAQQEAERQAQLKAQQESERQAKLQAEQEKQKQQNIQAGKISGQVELSAAGKTKEYSDYVKSLRKEAGTFGKGLGEATEVGMLQTYTGQEKKESERVYIPSEVIASGFTSSVLAGGTGKKETYVPETYKLGQKQKKEFEMQAQNDFTTATQVPASMLGGLFTTPITEKEYEQTGGNLFGYLNPVKHYEILKSAKQYEKDLKTANKIAEQLENLNVKYSENKIDWNEYSSKWNSLAQNKAYKNVISEDRKTLFQRIAVSKLTEGQKGVVSAVIGGIDIGTYAIAPVRVLRGIGQVSSGIENFGLAETKMEKLSAGGEIAFGSLLTASGFKGGTKIIPEFKVGRTAGKIIGFTGNVALPVGFSGLYGYSQYKQTGSTSVGIGAGLGSLAGFELPEIAKRVSFKTPKKETPTEEMEKAVEPFTRKRATILLKEEGTGKYILGETKGGLRISIGGGIEKGQTPKEAALAELSQETGLKLKDITGFKYEKKFVFPEETHYLFTGIVKRGVKIKPASDLFKISSVSPSVSKDLLGREITGQSILYPISRRRIRSYELGLINYLETGNKPTWLFVETKLGKAYLGTTSRYNVPAKEQLKFLKEKDLFLSSLSPSPMTSAEGEKLFEGTLSTAKEVPIIKARTKRGQASGVYVHPPASLGNYPEVVKLEGYTGAGKTLTGKEIKNLPLKVPKVQEGYFGLGYAGFGKEMAEGTTITFGEGKSIAYILKETPKYPITATPKTYAGIEEELIIREGILGTTGKASSVFLGGKKLYIQPIQIIKPSTTPKGFKNKGLVDFSSIGKNYLSISGSRIASGLSMISSQKDLSKSIREINIFERFSKGEKRKSEKLIKSEPFKSKPERYSFLEPSNSIKELREVPKSPPYPPYKKPSVPKKEIFPAVLRIRLKEKSKAKPQLFRQPTQYTPSFTGSALGLKVSAREVKGYEAKGFGALRLRGVVSEAKRRKNRKKILGV